MRPKVVRVAAVNTTLSTGVLQAVIPAFTEQTGFVVEFVGESAAKEGNMERGKGLFDAARAGKVDLLIAHYGKSYLETFVMDGLGAYPNLAFANQAALIGPESDPAKISGMSDAGQALRKIAASGSPYVVNNLDGLKYLSSLMWHAAGQPDKGSWWIEQDRPKARAVREAEKRNGYVLFGVPPFLHFKKKHDSKMRMMVVGDPILQRTMATVVVNPQRIKGVNHKGAVALQRYLVSAAVQAQIRAFRIEGTEDQFWWPMGRSNDPHKLTW